VYNTASRPKVTVWQGAGVSVRALLLLEADPRPNTEQVICTPTTPITYQTARHPYPAFGAPW
jgi:hypothetical protein